MVVVWVVVGGLVLVWVVFLPLLTESYKRTYRARGVEVEVEVESQSKVWKWKGKWKWKGPHHLISKSEN